MLVFLWLAAIPLPGQQTAEPPPQSDRGAHEHRRSDFWLGDWDVVPNHATPPPADPVGRHAITLAHGGRVLVDKWRTDTMTGQSVNDVLYTKRQP